MRRKPHEARRHGVLAPSARAAARAECVWVRDLAHKYVVYLQLRIFQYTYVSAGYYKLLLYDVGIA